MANPAETPDIMNEGFERGTSAEGFASSWGMALEAAVCERCDWSYLLPQNSLPQHCPHCFQSPLIPLVEQVEELPYTRPPELLLPFTLSSGKLADEIQTFAKGIPFAPSDLNPRSLQGRLQRLYLPRWLVDADVKAIWQAEAGFDYQVVSHQERYDQNRAGWTSRQVNEGRIRWEPRLGRLERSYHNIDAPALEEGARIKASVGKYNLEDVGAYQSEALAQSFVRLPNRIPDDAWMEAKPAFRRVAAEECQKAASADHIRQFSWQPEYHNQNWTLLLLPLYTTYYLDDERKPQPVLVNGQTGRLSGARRASMKRGQRASLILLVVAVVVFIVSLLLSAASIALPVLLVIGVIGLMISLLIGIGTILPIAVVWWFNRGQATR